jgi:putative endopeptidase
MNIKEKLRDIEINNYKVKFIDFNKKMYNIKLILYIKMIIKIMDNKLNINDFEYIIVENDLENDYFKKLNDLLIQTDINILKLYLKWKYINNYLPEINIEANELYFNLYHKLLKGQKKQKSLNKISINKCKIYFGDLIGKYFGKLHFDNKIKEYICKMINNIKLSCNDKFKDIKWMDYNTKLNAIEKLNNIKLNIGFNEYIKNYDDLYINDDIFTNLINTEILLSKDNLMKIKNNINDDNEWLMNAFEVNASYNPYKNIITLPCGILQQDILKYEINNNEYIFDDEYNYATIGTIIGHEIIHAFDDQGRLFDKDGNLNNWWSKSDNEKYKVMVEKMINMYNFENINGNLTIGENIADIGGITISLNALKIQNNNNLSKEKLEKFFKSYAYLWKTKLTDEYIKMVKLTDYHSLPWIRVNTTLKNIDEFYEVFNIINGYEKKDRINIFN